MWSINWALISPSELSLLAALFSINPLMGTVMAPEGRDVAHTYSRVRHGAEGSVRNGAGSFLESEEACFPACPMESRHTEPRLRPCHSSPCRGCLPEPRLARFVLGKAENVLLTPCCSLSVLSALSRGHGMTSQGLCSMLHV